MIDDRRLFLELLIRSLWATMLSSTMFQKMWTLRSLIPPPLAFPFLIKMGRSVVPESRITPLLTNSFNLLCTTPIGILCWAFFHNYHQNHQASFLWMKSTEFSSAFDLSGEYDLKVSLKDVSFRGCSSHFHQGFFIVVRIGKDRELSLNMKIV